jgi:hypothetical protein
VHELRDPRELPIVDVLRLVRPLVVVPVRAGAHEDDGNPVSSIHVVVAPAVALLRMPLRVVSVVERESMAAARSRGRTAAVHAAWPPRMDITPLFIVPTSWIRARKDIRDYSD